MFDNISRCLPCSSLKFAQGAGAIWGAAYEVPNACAIFDPLNLSSYPLIIVGRVHCTHSNNFTNESLILPCSGVSIIADVAESIAETQPISINRIEIWDRLIGKIQ